MIGLTELQRDVMMELLNIGMGRAAAVLCEMFREEVDLSIPFVDLLPRRTATGLIMEKGAERIVAVQQRFSGLFWGDTMLVFPEEKSLELVRALIQEKSSLDIMTEMEQEAFMEIGNIILNSCIGSISELLHSEVSGSLPVLLSGSCEDILGKAGALPADEQVMVLRMDFTLHERWIKGCVVFIIDGNAMDALQESIDQLLQRI
jgi:chemotaxis protein CheC